MSRALQKYLDHVMIYANRNKEDADRIRAELEDHLRQKVADLEADGLSREDAIFRAIEEHGEPWIVGYGLRKKKLRFRQVAGWVSVPFFILSFLWLLFASCHIYRTLSPGAREIVVLAGPQAKANMKVEGHHVTFLPVEGEASFGGSGITVYHWSALGPLMIGTFGVVVVLALMGIGFLLTRRSLPEPAS